MIYEVKRSSHNFAWIKIEADTPSEASQIYVNNTGGIIRYFGEEIQVRWSFPEKALKTVKKGWWIFSKTFLVEEEVTRECSATFPVILGKSGLFLGEPKFI